MRAKFIYESLESLQFQRGEDPRQILNIGQRSIIEDWFKDIQRQKRYKINYTINDKLTTVVYQHLYLANLNIDWLPDNLRIKGSLDLSNTKISKLPDNLSVEKDLFLRNTNITKLPPDLNVRGLIFKDF